MLPAWMRCRLLPGVALLALSVCAPTARANGRYPFQQQLVVAPNDRDRLWLRASYGYLTSADRGKTWRWVCEESIGYSGTDDPALGVTADGRVLAGIFSGLSTSTDLGCNFSLSDPGLKDQYVVDLTVEQVDPTRAVVLVSQGDANSVFRNQVWRSTDSAASFTQLGQNFDPDVLGLTLDPAPSDPTRIYVSGIGQADGGVGSVGVLLRSDDDGKSWTRFEIPGTGQQATPFIAAVHPTDPDRVFVRVNSTTTDLTTDDDSLITTADGGAHWTELLHFHAYFGGFALSPDGNTVLAGFGDSHESQLAYDKDKVGLYSASITDLNFTRVIPGRFSCAAWTINGIYLCASQFDTGFELSVTPDLATTPTTLMKLADLQGPLQCDPTSTTASRCEARWLGPNNLCERLGRCDAGVAAGGSGGGGGGSGGGSGGSGNGATPGAGGSGGCGCRLVDRADPTGVAWLLGAGLVLLVRRRACGAPSRWTAPRTLRQGGRW